ncbi:hypothetical protein [Pseudomonas asiatica]|uniref:hypothetical protein n=1 Tax=Pseudomonas asiatica TaxID=2219225 RepID=UPI0014783653|nr:hypothetical protein [Pseudomonas asiatica]
MPTENRSSNTDPRDVFIRLNPLGLGEEELRKDSSGFEDQRTHSDYLLFLAGYRETHPEPQQHTEQHQGEPVAWRGFNELGEVVTEWIDGAPPSSMVDLSGNPASFARIERAYTNADPGEVERCEARLHEVASLCASVEQERDALRAQLAECEAMAAMIAEREWAEHAGTGPVSSKVEAAFTQLHNDLHEVGEKLAERDALLRELADAPPAAMEFRLQQKVKAALSASAEPQVKS